MTRTLLVRNKQPQHSLPGIADKQTSSVKKIRRKCTLSAPYFKKIRRKCATVAPYSMLYRFLCNAVQRAREKSQKYGANAPQLHPIRCSIDFYVMLCNRLSTQWTQATQAIQVIQMLQKCCFSASAISFLIRRTRLDHVTSRVVIGELSGRGLKRLRCYVLICWVL
jgi:hypothetical protein